MTANALSLSRRRPGVGKRAMVLSSVNRVCIAAGISAFSKLGTEKDAVDVRCAHGTFPAIATRTPAEALDTTRPFLKWYSNRSLVSRSN